MLPSARRHASLLRPVGASYLFEMSKVQGKAGRLTYDAILGKAGRLTYGARGRLR